MERSVQEGARKEQFTSDGMRRGAFGFFVAIAIALVVLSPSALGAAVAATVTSPFHFTFDVAGTVYETGSMSESSSPYWWVNSGAWMSLSGGRGWTAQGNLPIGNYWQKLYAANNPLDTDGGFHPQNIFRLVSRSRIWDKVRTQAYFVVKRDNLSASPNRDGHNGLLVFSRYVDNNNLYYAGVRVDGKAIIKKKKGGAYTTLASQTLYPGTYNRTSNPNLLPKNSWIGIRSEVTTNLNGSATIKLYVDRGWTGLWTLAAQATDTNPVYGPGSVGIRTDFMDVMFEDFRTSSIP